MRAPPQTYLACNRNKCSSPWDESQFSFCFGFNSSSFPPYPLFFLTSLSNMTLSWILFVVSSSNCKLDNNKLGNNNMDKNNKLVDNNNMERENVDHSARVWRDVNQLKCKTKLKCKKYYVIMNKKWVTNQNRWMVNMVKAFQAVNANLWIFCMDKNR